MGWLGKLVGGTIGFALGGPLGAVAGAVFGHAFDRNSESQYIEGGYRAHLSMAEEDHMTFFVAAFSMLAKLVRVDGAVTRPEMESIERFMRTDLNLSPQSRTVAMNIFNTALNSPQSFQDFARHFHSRFRYQPEILHFMIDILLRVSIADGEISRPEDELILSGVRIFGISDADYQKLKSKYAPRSDKYYAILGAAPSDPDEKIKSRYRQLVSDFHPDKIAAKGLPEEFTKFAQDKFVEIQDAWEKIRQERGIK